MRLKITLNYKSNMENPNMQLIAKYISPQYQDELAQLADELDLIPTTVAPLEPI